MTFSALKADVENWFVRSDFPVTIYTEATARINRDLRVREMLSDYSASVSAETIALPTDYLEFDHVYVDRTPRVPLTAASPYAMSETHYPSGVPTMYAVDGANLRLNPVPDGTYTLAGKYFAKLAAFSADSDTNDVLTTFPEIYRLACLMLCFEWARNSEEQAKATAGFRQAVEDANDAYRKSRHGGRLRSRPRAYA